MDRAKELLHQYRIEKLLVVDDDGKLCGLMTIKDIEKTERYPNACKDELGRLRCGAAVGVGADRQERTQALRNPFFKYQIIIWRRWVVFYYERLL